MSMGAHQSANMVSDTWLTPPEIIQALGPFDLDPCTPDRMPWETAGYRYIAADNGLNLSWHGRVWLNPPYSNEARAWIKRLSDHGHGTALIFARTETAWFWDAVWRSPTARGILFFEGRLHFHDENGVRAKANAGAPSVLVAYGDDDAKRLRESGLRGAYLPLPAANLTSVSTDANSQERD